MPAHIEVEFDEARQIIRQRVGGELEVEDFERIDELTRACAARLHNPGDVRILVDATGLGRSSARARRAMIAALKRPTLTRMAVLTPGPIGRVILRFLVVATGAERARGFASEDEAVTWLLS